MLCMCIAKHPAQEDVRLDEARYSQGFAPRYAASIILDLSDCDVIEAIDLPWELR